MQRWRYFVPAEKHYAKEARFEEKGGQDFIKQQWSGNTAGKLRKAAPVGTKLISHHQAGYDTHPKIDGEDLQPEIIERAPEIVSRAQPHPLQHHQIAGQSNRNRGKKNMERDSEGELKTG